MKSKTVLNFIDLQTMVFDKYEPVLNLNISNSYWPPIIDLDCKNASCQVSGPLLAVFIEICKKYHFSMTYIKPEQDLVEIYYSMLSNGTIDVLLFPTIPTLDEMPNILTTSLGFVNMISLLSGVGWKNSRIFNFLHCFEPRAWIVLGLSLVISSTLASHLKSSWGQFLFFYSILLNQSNKLVLKQMERIYAFLLLCWVISCTFIFCCFHEALLSTIFHEKAHVLIDSLENMAQFAMEGKLREFYALNGESCEHYINERTDIIGTTLKPKMKIIDVEEDEKDKWEHDIFPKLSSGQYVLISDNSYLDYYFTTKLAEYPNIYRGTEEIVALPYFVALSSNVPGDVRSNIDKLILELIESGIFEYWVKDTLYLNNEALRLGLIDMNGQRGGEVGTKRLQLRHLFGNYLILFFGSFLSIIVLIGEIFLNRNNDKNLSIYIVSRLLLIKNSITQDKFNPKSDLDDFKRYSFRAKHRKSAGDIYFDNSRYDYHGLFKLDK